MIKPYKQSPLLRNLIIALLAGVGLLGSQNLAAQTVTLNGSVYADVDSNCSKGSIDFGLDSVKVYLLDNSSNKIDSARTSSSGAYSFQVDTAVNSTVNVQFLDTGNFRHTCQSPTQATSNPGSQSVDFGLNRPSANYASRIYVDSVAGGNCNTPNTTNYFALIIPPSAPSVPYKINFDDGNGYSVSGLATSDTIRVSNAFSSTGTYNVTAYLDSFGTAADKVQTSVTVTNSCDSIAGRAYIDSSGDCAYQASEKVLDQRTVQLRAAATDSLISLTQTDGQGQYNFTVSSGQNYDVVFRDTGNLTHGCVSNATQNVTSLPASNVNFGLSCNGTDFKASASSLQFGSFRVGRARNLSFSIKTNTFCNTDTLEAVRVILDSSLSTSQSRYPASTAYPQFTSISGDTVKYNLQQTTASDFTDVKLPIYTNTAAQLATQRCVTVELVASGDVNVSNDQDILCRTVTNSFDPNNKRVSPAGTTDSGFIQSPQPLSYTINFQNNGNDTAFNVTIEDTLDTDLDPATVSVQSSSDPYSVNINNRVLTFNFNNIDLPDSGANFSGSQGFIEFEVAPQSGVPAGTRFTNYADITFDVNTTIRTDTAVNTICSPISDTIRPTACGEYVYPGDGRTFSSSGTYFDTLAAANGCDSVVRIELTVKPTPTPGFVQDTGVCSYTVPSGNRTLFTDTFVTDTLRNAAANGCDSLVDVSITVLNVVRDTISAVGCTSYTVPSGDESYTNSGTYTDTLAGRGACDSILTINLTIRDFAYDTFSVTACKSYELPSGDDTVTSSGQYNDTLPGQAGCDTVLSINVNIRQQVTSTVSRTVCDSFVVPSGDETYFGSGTYQDTLISVDGCDSVITFNLTVNQVKRGVIAINTCKSYTVPSGDETYTTNGTYEDTLTTTKGCDSIITINLTLRQEVTSSIVDTVCSQYTVPSGDETYTSSGTYTDTLTSANGCDSVITINLTVKPSKATTISATTCNTYTVPSGDESYSIAGTYRDTIPASNGCDSLLTINLTVAGSLDPSVNKTDKTLQALVSNADYQWLICDTTGGYKPIDGSSSRTFRAFKSASYAVAVEKDGCQDTSSCIQVQNVGLGSQGSARSLTVYPNPTDDQLKVEVPGNADRLELISSTGQKVRTTAVTGRGTQTIRVKTLPAGVYVLKVYSEKQIQTQRVLIR